MYEFVDTNDNYSGSFAPSDNVKINGQYLNDLVEGYKQLVVSGRGVMSQEIENIKIPSRDGVYAGNVSIPPRIITIKYQLDARSSSELRNRFSELNKFLANKSELKIEFDDDKGWVYHGYLATSEDFEEDKLSIISSFTILCTDPYAYSSLKTSNPVTLEYADKMLPTKIELIGTNTSKIEIKSGTNKIVLNGSYPSGSKITLEWTNEELLIKRGTQNILTDLAWNSYPETFFLYSNSPITVTGATLDKIEWRDKKL